MIPAFLSLFSCLASAEPSPTTSPKAETGLAGVITIGPIHGGPSNRGEPDSKPLSNTAFVVRQEDRTVAEFRTDEQGRFRVLLAPGHYNLGAKDQTNRFGAHGPYPVEVIAGEMKQIHWDCDSGLR